MAFRYWDTAHIARFNSAVTCKLLTDYEVLVDSKIAAERSRTPHHTFAPSQLRCDRRSWFRIRGVEPDKIPTPDRQLQFAADIGTACHRMIQSNLQELLGDGWINVEEYLKKLNPEYTYKCTPSEESYEYFVDIEYPPVRFACDGIICIDGIDYLLEIKSCDPKTWEELTGPKEEHIDQVYAYSALLKLKHVIMLYIDRQYGRMKFYELTIPEYKQEEVETRFKYVMDMVEKNIAPEGLPKGDKWCQPNYCPYYKKCQEYGR